MSELTDKAILDICDEALALAEPKRQAFLNRVCQQDRQLLARVQELMRAIDDSGEFLKLDP